MSDSTAGCSWVNCQIDEPWTIEYQVNIIFFITQFDHITQLEHIRQLNCMINMLILLFLSVRTEKYIPPASKTSGSLRPRAACETSGKYFYTFRKYKPVNNIYIYIYIYIWRIDQENCSIYKAIKSCWKWFLQEDKVYLSWYHCCLCVIKSTGTHLFYFWRQVWKCLWVCRFTRFKFNCFDWQLYCFDWQLYCLDWQFYCLDWQFYCFDLKG